MASHAVARVRRQDEVATSPPSFCAAPLSGFEPKLTGSEPIVLPLHHRGMPELAGGFLACVACQLRERFYRGLSLPTSNIIHAPAVRIELTPRGLEALVLPLHQAGLYQALRLRFVHPWLFTTGCVLCLRLGDQPRTADSASLCALLPLESNQSHAVNSRAHRLGAKEDHVCVWPPLPTYRQPHQSLGCLTMHQIGGTGLTHRSVGTRYRVLPRPTVLPLGSGVSRSHSYRGYQENRTLRTDLARISRPLGTWVPSNIQLSLCQRHR